MGAAARIVANGTLAGSVVSLLLTLTLGSVFGAWGALVGALAGGGMVTWHMAFKECDSARQAFLLGLTGAVTAPSFLAVIVVVFRISPPNAW